MYNLLLASLTIVALQVPQPPPNPGWWPAFSKTVTFDVPDGKIPWDLPIFPNPTANEDVTPEAPSHSDDYEDKISKMQERFDSVQQPIEDADAQMEELLGTGGMLEDITGEDAVIPVDVEGYDNISVLTTASALGDKIGLIFSYARAIATQTDYGSEITYLFLFIFLCIVWMMFIRAVTFAINVADFCFNVVTKIIELIPGVE